MSTNIESAAEGKFSTVHPSTFQTRDVEGGTLSSSQGRTSCNLYSRNKATKLSKLTLKKLHKKNQSVMIFDSKVKAIVKEQHNCYKRQEKNQEKLLDHRYKMTCDEINDKIDMTMLGLQKYSDENLLDSTQYAQSVIREGLNDLLENCKGNRDVHLTIRNISKSQAELYEMVKSLHMRYKAMVDDHWNKKDKEVKEDIEATSLPESQKRDPKMSTFEAVKEIDKSIQDLVKDQIQRRKDIFMTKKFSGVDDKLHEVYKYLDMIGNGKVEASTLLSRSNGFDDVQGFVINQAKALQITSSKALVSKLVTNKPKMVTRGTQDNYGGTFLNEVDRLNIKVHEKDKEIRIKEAQLVSLRERYTNLGNESNSLQKKVKNLSLRVENFEKETEEYKRQLALKIKIITSYEDQITEITRDSQRTIVHLKSDLKLLEAKIIRKDEIIEKLKSAKLSRTIRNESVAKELVEMIQEAEQDRKSEGSVSEISELVGEIGREEIDESRRTVGVMNQRNKGVQAFLRDEKVKCDDKRIQTMFIDLTPKIIATEAECPNCSLIIKDGNDMNIQCQTSFDGLSPEKRLSTDSMSQENSIINIKLVTGVDSEATDEEISAQKSKKKRKKSPMKKAISRLHRKKSSLLDEISEEDEEEALQKAKPTAEEKELLDKYGSRFSGGQGGAVSSSTSFVPKVIFKKEFSTPRVGKETPEFETVYFSQTQKKSETKEVKLKSFMPVMKNNSTKKIPSGSPMKFRPQRAGTLNPISDCFLSQPKYESEGDSKRGGKNKEPPREYIGFHGSDVNFG